MGPVAEFVQIPLDGIPFLNSITQLSVIFNLAEGALDPFVLLMKIFNNTGPSMDPWGTPLITDVHQGSKPFTSILWMGLSNQFLTI